MPDIKKLDQSTILKLAAGEIIDRPVSIVKECIENSIDAGASKIIIDTVQGGIAEIRIEDNGCGILNNDMSLAVEPHATSKLVEFQDLDHVMSMGFRGEALASISEVADVTIHSFNPSDDIGSELIKSAGHGITLAKKAREKGTTILVQHLFKKVPVRFRFLKSPASEGNLITRLIQQFSLHYPMIQFEYKNNHVPVLFSSGKGDLKVQFSEALKINMDDILEFSKETNGVQVSGVITVPSKSYKQRSKCWFTVNGRLVKSPVFFRALDQALADSMPKQLYPAIVCNIKCNTELVDINIHPKKEDVKFLHQDELFIAIKRAVKSALLAPAPSWRKTSASINDLQRSETIHHTDIKVMPKSNISSDQTLFSHNINTSKPREFPAKDDPKHLPINAINKHRLNVKEPVNPSPLVSTTASIKWLTFKNKYIIVPLSDHVLLFDQHAVHERVLYDRYKAEFNEAAIISMPLLVPEYIELSPVDATQIKALIPLIRSMGLDFDEFDETTFILRELPQFFSTIDIKAWLTQWLSLDSLEELKEHPESEKIAMLQMKACKAAVKAGQRLHDKEITSLIDMCMNSDEQYTCPHGRPLYIKLSEHQLDTLFLRS